MWCNESQMYTLLYDRYIPEVCMTYHRLSCCPGGMDGMYRCVQIIHGTEDNWDENIATG
jgi:hypothetical protein